MEVALALALYVPYILLSYILLSRLHALLYGSLFILYFTLFYTSHCTL